MANKTLAKLDPSSVFKRPEEVLKDPSLSRLEKIEVLKSWAYDERELSVAEEENMLATGLHTSNDTLSEILKSLLILGVSSDQDKPPPTKQG